MPRALVNGVVSVVLCLYAVAIGHTLGSWLNASAVQVAQTQTEEES